ncbi:MAG: ECF-type sigma factor [Acidobacteriota bacterium]
MNEAYLRLIDWKGVSWQNPADFLGVAAQPMRHILVDFARKRPLAEGDQEAVHVSLDEVLHLAPGKSAEVIDVGDALKSLATFDPRKSPIVELRYFEGLSVEETVEVLGVARITVIREWNKAKAWLYRELLNNSDKWRVASRLSKCAIADSREVSQEKSSTQFRKYVAWWLPRILCRSAS